MNHNKKPEFSSKLYTIDSHSSLGELVSKIGSSLQENLFLFTTAKKLLLGPLLLNNKLREKDEQPLQLLFIKYQCNPQLNRKYIKFIYKKIHMCNRWMIKFNNFQGIKYIICLYNTPLWMDIDPINGYIHQKK